jgi:hypothetical protein
MRWRALSAATIQNVELPGALPAIGAAMVLLAAAVIASVLPAARASRVDVVQAAARRLTDAIRPGAEAGVRRASSARRWGAVNISPVGLAG